MIINSTDGAVNSGFTGSKQPIIQNLGPANIYIGPYDDAETLFFSGLYLPAGAVYEFPATLVEGASVVYIYADADTGGTSDVRIINVG